MNRRSLLNTSTLILPAVALAACTNALSTVGGAIGSAAVAKLVSYIQGAVTGLSVLAATFLPTNANVQNALTGLGNFASSIGTSISSGASWLTGTTASQFEGWATAAVAAIKAGLSLLPGGATLTLAETILDGISSFIPQVVSFFNSLLGGAAPAPVTPPATAALSVASWGPLRLMVP